MLTNFFGKSNPLIFFLLSLYVIAGYIFWIVKISKVEVGNQPLFVYILTGALLIFFIFLLDFIIRKNNLTRLNTYAILLFVCFLFFAPALLGDTDILMANFFLLLSLRRILSLSSEKKIGKKILDASIWISVATLFYFWSLFFFVVLFIAIIRIPNYNFRYILIPIIGVATVFIVATTYNILLYDSIFWFKGLNTSYTLEFSKYSKPPLVVSISVLSAFLIYCVIYRLMNLSSVSKKDKSNYLILIILLAACGSLTVMAPEKTGAELFFILSPLAIIMTNYLERIKTFWLKEIIFWIVIVVPEFVFFYESLFLN